MLILFELLVAPVDSVSKRPVPLRDVARSAGEQFETLVQTPEDRLGRQQLDQRRRELDREWEAVKPPADLRDRRCILLRQLEVGAGRSRPLDEELDRRGDAHRAWRPGLLLRESKRGKDELMLSTQLQCGLARRQDLEAAGGREHPGNQGRSLENLVEVVQQDECRACRESDAESLEQRVLARLLDSKRLGDDGRDEPWLSRVGKLDVEHALEGRGRRGRHLECEPALPRPRGARDRHEPGVGRAEQPDELVDLILGGRAATSGGPEVVQSAGAGAGATAATARPGRPDDRGSGGVDERSAACEPLLGRLGEHPRDDVF